MENTDTADNTADAADTAVEITSDTEYDVPALISDFEFVGSNLPIVYPEKVTFDQAVKMRTIYNLISCDDQPFWASIYRNVIHDCCLLIVNECSSMQYFRANLGMSMLELQRHGLLILNRDRFKIHENGIFYQTSYVPNRVFLSIIDEYSIDYPMSIKRDKRRMWYSFMLWLRFCFDNFAFAYTIYCNYLLYTRQFYELEQFTTIRIIPLILCGHPMAFKFWGYALQCIPLCSESQFFLNNFFPLIEELNIKMNIRLLERYQGKSIGHYVLRNEEANTKYMVDNTEIADGFRFVSSSFNTYEWWRVEEKDIYKFKRFFKDDLCSPGQIYTITQGFTSTYCRHPLVDKEQSILPPYHT
jgi:hypothetical protein